MSVNAPCVRFPCAKAVSKESPAPVMATMAPAPTVADSLRQPTAATIVTTCPGCSVRPDTVCWMKLVC